MRVYKYNSNYNTLNNSYIRQLNNAEMKAITLVEDFIKSFHEELYQKYKNTSYTTGQKMGILGQYETNSYNDEIQHIFLSTEIFTMPFTHAIGVVLHEWLHIFGGDGSKYFTYALTDIIILLLSDKDLVKKVRQYENEWEKMTTKIIDQNKSKRRK